MDSIRSVLPSVLHKRGLHSHAQASLITHRAQMWIAEEMTNCKDLLHVSTLRDGVLTIAADHGIAAQECLEQIPRLKAALLAEYPEIRLQEIVVQRGR